MKIEQEIWTVADFVNEREQIQIAPAWQRGAAWTPPRQVLLIDSMLRSLDIPKVYLRVKDQHGTYSYDAVDGQQRLRAIWLFRDNELPLKHVEKLEPIGKEDVNGKRYSELPKRLRDAFDAFEITVAKIVESDQLAISRLFSRLQQGVPLNPAELRNAMLGPVRNLVEAIALSNEFFVESRIPQLRYRRQDYVAHVFALAAHGTEQDIKAANLKHLYQEFNPGNSEALMRINAEVQAAFTFLHKLNGLVGLSIRHKWIVVDLAWWVIQKSRQQGKLDASIIASKFQKFDALRRKYTSAPEDVLTSSDVNKRLSRSLYSYLVAFKLQGGTKGNVLTRSNAIDQFLGN